MKLGSLGLDTLERTGLHSLCSSYLHSQQKKPVIAEKVTVKVTVENIAYTSEVLRYNLKTTIFCCPSYSNVS